MHQVFRRIQRVASEVTQAWMVKHLRLRQAYGIRFTSQPPNATVMERILRISELSRVVKAWGGGRANCLLHLLKLWQMLLRYGHNTDIWAGVSQINHGLSAHAWVGFAGNVLSDLEDANDAYPTFGRPLVNSLQPAPEI